MSVPSYQFHFLPLKLLNKGVDFPFPPLKVPNKGREGYSNLFIFFFSFISISFHSLLPNEGLGCAELVANVSNPILFLDSTSNAYLNAFPKSDWADLGVPRKVWMFSFQNTGKMKFQ